MVCDSELLFTNVHYLNVTFPYLSLLRCRMRILHQVSTPNVSTNLHLLYITHSQKCSSADFQPKTSTKFESSPREMAQIHSELLACNSENESNWKLHGNKQPSIFVHTKHFITTLLFTISFSTISFLLPCEVEREGISVFILHLERMQPRIWNNF